VRDLTRAPWDPSNTLLAETQVQVTVESMDTPAGPRLVLTLRTSSTTTTVFLRKGNAIDAGEKILSEARKLPGLALADVLQEV
jgi:hypothetical protein